MTGFAILPFALLCGAGSARESLLPRTTGDDFSAHVGPRWRSESLGPGLTSWFGRLHHRHGHFDSSLCHPDGIHWQFHRHYALIYLAVLLSPQTKRSHSRLGYSRLRLFRHLPGHPVWRHRHLLFVPSSCPGFPDRLALLKILGKTPMKKKGNNVVHVNPFLPKFFQSKN